jgi:hypothetical protein
LSLISPTTPEPPAAALQLIHASSLIPITPQLELVSLQQLDAIKRALCYLKHTQYYKLVYSVTDSSKLFVTSSDADLGGNVDDT